MALAHLIPNLHTIGQRRAAKKHGQIQVTTTPQSTGKERAKTQKRKGGRGAYQPAQPEASTNDPIII